MKTEHSNGSIKQIVCCVFGFKKLIEENLEEKCSKKNISIQKGFFSFANQQQKDYYVVLIFQELTCFIARTTMQLR